MFFSFINAYAALASSYPSRVVAVAWTDMAGFVGQDALGLVQGVGVFVDDGVVAASFAAFGDFPQGVDALGGDLFVPDIQSPQRWESLAMAVRANMAIRWAPRREKIRICAGIGFLGTVKVTIPVIPWTI